MSFNYDIRLSQCEFLGVEAEVTIYVPAGSRDKYSNHDAWGKIMKIKEL